MKLTSTNPDLSVCLPIVFQWCGQALGPVCAYHSTKRTGRQFYQNYLPVLAEMERFACIQLSAGARKAE